jgi:hypothetical protein
MPKIHYFQRYSSIENTVTNNTLQLIARIYNYSNAQASKLLSDITGESIEIGIEVNQQERAKDSVPDGAIIQRSFKILIESKVDSGVYEDQLVRHTSNFLNETQKILLLLTKQQIGLDREKNISNKIAAKHGGGILFKNVTYEDICNSIKELFRDYEYEMKALVEDYIEYCNDVNLFDQSRYLMRILPCGKSLDLNKKYGIYFHPSDRGYTNHSFIGIYANKKVQCLWSIDSVFDVEYDGATLNKAIIQGRNTDEYDQKIISIIADAKDVCGYEIESGHRFFCGRQAIETNYTKSSSGGIQGARFVNLKDVIGQFTDDREVAEKLNGMRWE